MKRTFLGRRTVLGATTALALIAQILFPLLAARPAAAAPNDVVSITADPSATATEGNAGQKAFTFTITATNPGQVAGPERVHVATGAAGDTAVGGGTCAPGSGVDYVSQSTDVTIPASTPSAGPSTSSMGFTVQVCGDTAPEPNETFTVTISNPQLGGTLDPNASSATATIQNDDGAPPTLSVTNDVAAAEGTNPAGAGCDPDGNGGANPVAGSTCFVFNVSLSAAPGQPVTVPYSTQNGTATGGGPTCNNATGNPDYISQSGSVAFAAAETGPKQISVPVCGDVLNEADETFTVDLQPQGDVNCGVTAANDCVGQGTIQNDDPVPTLTILDTSAAEGSAGGSTQDCSGGGTPPPPTTGCEFFDVHLSVISGQTVTVNYASADGTAKSGSDYVGKTGTLTFPPGEQDEFVRISLVEDTIDEPNESFVVNLSGNNPTTATIADGSATGTINDDDPAPKATVTGQTKAEGNTATTTFTFTVTLDAPSSQTATMQYSTQDGPATANNDAAKGGAACGGPTQVDYIATLNGTLTIPAGQTTGTIDVPVCGDTFNEKDEAFSVVVSSSDSSVDCTTTPANCTATSVITNDDPLPVITVSNPSLAEGNSGSTTQFPFDITLSAPSGRDVVVNYSTGGGTATAGTDYTPASSTVTFSPGETKKTVNVDVIGDNLDEPDETFNLTVVPGATATCTTGDCTGQATIQDDDPAVSLSINDPQPQLEGNGPGATTLAFTVSESGATGQNVDVDYATGPATPAAGQDAAVAGASCTPGVDYIAASGTLHFQAGGAQTKQILVSVCGDTSAERDEVFAVNLSNPTNATIADGQGIGTIKNDDGVPAGITISDVSQNEGNSATTPFTFTVSLDAPSTNTVSVDYATADGTGTGAADCSAAATDYQSKSGTVTFAPGETSKPITISVCGDTRNEANDTFTVNLSNPTNGSVSDGQGLGTIQNDDPTPSLTIGDATAAEGSSGTVADCATTPATGCEVFTVTLSAASGQTVTVNYQTADTTATGAANCTTAGSDYVSQAGTLTFTPDQTTKTIVVPVCGDALDEANETFTVTLSSPSATATLGATTTGTGTITDDDPTPSVSVANTSVTEGNSGSAPACASVPATGCEVFTVTLSAASGQSVTVDYTTQAGTATAPGDYTTKSGTLTFAPGVTIQTVVVPVVGDTLAEPDETFTVVLSNPVNATLGTATGTGTITDDDANPTVSISPATQTVAESAGSVTVTVTLSAASGKTVTVVYSTANGTATAGSDYTAGTATLTFSPGQTSKTVTIGITDDAAHENNETFTVNLSSPSNTTVAAGQGTATVTIADNDPVPPRNGYWLVGRRGTVYGFGDAVSKGDAPLGQADAVDIESTPDGNGYWVLDAAGNVYGFGDAQFLGNMALQPGESATSMSAKPNGGGYWIFTNRGRVGAFGTAVSFGDMSGRPLNGPVIGSVATPSGNGYYMVATDGGIFAFGDAVFRGSMGGQPLNAPVVGLVPDPDGVGYWLDASDGGVFAFEAPFRGSMGGRPLNKPVIGMVSYGNGYLMVASDGGVFDFSDKPFSGSLGSNPPAIPIVNIAALPS